MKGQTIQKSIEINASRENVWDVLLQDQFTRIWYAEFSPGSYADTDWQVGSKAIFTDNSKDGLIGRVITNQPYEVISVEYQGVLAGGQEDYDSTDAQQMKGGKETYRLSEQNGVTQLSIESDMSGEYFESMSQAWEKALQKVKELAESRKAEKGN